MEKMPKIKTKPKFKKGDKVIKTLTYFGGSEKEERTVHSVTNGVVYLQNPQDTQERENGITYDLDGFERERFFPGMLARIQKI